MPGKVLVAAYKPPTLLHFIPYVIE